jgi:hypothetical protein
MMTTKLGTDADARSCEMRGVDLFGVAKDGVQVRRGLPEDEEKVSELLELNGMPRSMAFEERFIVAEREERVLAAMRYQTAPKRLLLGLLVADPWAGERDLAVALYAGVSGLAREMGAQEIRAPSDGRASGAWMSHLRPGAALSFPRPAGAGFLSCGACSRCFFWAFRG